LLFRVFKIQELNKVFLHVLVVSVEETSSSAASAHSSLKAWLLLAVDPTVAVENILIEMSTDKFLFFKSYIKEQYR